MDKVRAYYKPGEGYLIYMPDGSPIPYIKNISIHDNWLESSSRVGTTRVQSIATADVSLNVDVVNEPPVINPDLTDIDKIQAYINVNNSCNPSFKAGLISDGYHTFDELYQHRYLLFINWAASEVRLWRTALLNNIPGYQGTDCPFWITRVHSDSTPSYDGYFLAGLWRDRGIQITYHIPNEYWELAAEYAEICDIAPCEWNGHTSADVLKRLAEL